MFDVRDKVAIVTGGVGGIGLAIVKQLLKNGVRGVTIVDINETRGQEVLKDIEREFGSNKAIFVRADVSKHEQFEDVFKKTLSQFKNIDILSNNAGVLDDINWHNEIAVNLNGTITGTLLAFEKYILNHRSGEEGVILNTASITGIQFFPVVPLYATTKFAIVGLTGCLGHEAHYNRTKIKLIAICPGKTETDMTNNPNKVRPYCEPFVKAVLDNMQSQPPEAVAEVALDVIKNAKTGTVWVAEDGKGFEFKIPNRIDFAP